MRMEPLTQILHPEDEGLRSSFKTDLFYKSTLHKHCLYQIKVKDQIKSDHFTFASSQPIFDMTQPRWWMSTVNMVDESISQLFYQDRFQTSFNQTVWPRIVVCLSIGREDLAIILLKLVSLVHPEIKIFGLSAEIHGLVLKIFDTYDLDTYYSDFSSQGVSPHASTTSSL